MNTRPIETRLLEKIIINDSECWIWTGPVDGRGYGMIWYKGRAQRVHRVTFMLENEVDLSGEDDICHKCNNPICCNPKHLYLGDAKTNMQDRAISSSWSKLSLSNVLEIRETVTEENKAELSRKFGVSYNMIYLIETRRRWNYTDEEIKSAIQRRILA